MNGNLPPGTTDRMLDEHFGDDGAGEPTRCDECGADAFAGSRCPNPDCGEHVPTAAERAEDAEADAFDRMLDAERES